LAQNPHPPIPNPQSPIPLLKEKDINKLFDLIIVK